ncbi:MAG: TonB-dependent receptor plug domain-containing protein [Gemmatimonadetes bacterium]|nr:TonB-dependent receptor plug domain-containing protein [Gemmatimonadota bacterium]
MSMHTGHGTAIENRQPPWPRTRQLLVRWSVLVALLALMAAPALAQQSHLQGRVLESASKTPLAGAVIVVSDHSVGTLSDEEGRFSLAVGGEQLILEVNLIGYRPWQSGQISLVRGDTLTIDIQLEINAISLREITVTPGRFAIMGDATGSRQALSQEEIQTIPQFGEDIFRSVTRLPGVTGNDYSARFTIRGGEQEEVLVRLDGVELFEHSI